MANPPRDRPSRRLAAAYSPWLMPDMANKLPMRMNNGMTDRVYDRPLSKAIVPTIDQAEFQSRIKAKPTAPTSAMANAIGTLMKIKVSRAAKPINDSNKCTHHHLALQIFARRMRTTTPLRPQEMAAKYPTGANGRVSEFVTAP